MIKKLLGRIIKLKKINHDNSRQFKINIEVHIKCKAKIHSGDINYNCVRRVRLVMHITQYMSNN